MFPDHHQGTGVRLDIVSRAQMIRIGVGLQDPGHGQQLALHEVQQRIGRGGAGACGGGVVIQHRIDDGRHAAVVVVDDVAQRTGVLVMEGLHLRCGGVRNGHEEVLGF